MGEFCILCVKGTMNTILHKILPLLSAANYPSEFKFNRECIK